MNSLKKIGLTNAYRNEENTQEVFQCLLALVLLTVTDIDLAFKDVTAMDTEDSRSTAQLEQFCRLFTFVLVFNLSIVFLTNRHVHKEWLTKNSTGPSQLSVQDNISHTNNAVKSFRAAPLRRIKTAHLNLFAFFGHL